MTKLVVWQFQGSSYNEVLRHNPYKLQCQVGRQEAGATRQIVIVLACLRYLQQQLVVLMKNITHSSLI